MRLGRFIKIFGSDALLAQQFVNATVVKFDVLKGVDLLNAAVIQNRSCKRPSVCGKVLYTLINLAAVFRSGGL